MLSACLIQKIRNRPTYEAAGRLGIRQRNRLLVLDLSDNIKCDALIVGGGITGSLIAERLTRQGLDVVIIDRELPGRGSTAASTSMLLWEIDRSLTQLTEIYGFDRASRAYRASLDAVTGLRSLVHHLGISCELRDKQSLYLAVDDTSKKLLREHELRERAGLPGVFLDHGRLLDVFGIARAGALVSPGAADADPAQPRPGNAQDCHRTRCPSIQSRCHCF